MQDPGFEIVQDNPTRNGAKKGERPHMAVQPRRGVHTPHDSDEHVARERQDQDERVQDHRFAGLRIGPLAEPSVIDLGLLAWRWIVAAHRDTQPPPVGFRKSGQRVAAERRQAGL